VLRLIGNSPFAPRDILEALASDESSDKMYNLLANGGNIHGHMSRLGYKRLEEGEDPVMSMNVKSLAPPGEIVEEALGIRGGFDQKKWWNDNFPDQQIKGEFEEEDKFDDGFAPRSYKGLKGEIVHFIPASQMKVLQGYLVLIRYTI
jgi:hypothetical protein